MVSNKTVQLFLFCLVFAVFSSNVAAENIEQLYRKQCGTCHGNDGDGRGRASANLDPPASSFIDPHLKSRLSRSYIAQIIRDGKPGTAMFGYGRRLNDQQIDQLAKYIGETFVNSQSSTPAPSTDRGKQLYVKHCSACHGDNGNTAVWARNGLNPPPRNFTSAASREELSRERMLTSVTYGRPGTAMMSFKSRLSTEEIELVVDFVRREFMGMNSSSSSLPAVKKSPVAPVVQDKDSFPDGLVGDVVEGEKFYMHNCFTCHGKKGDGNGPRANFNQPRPRNFTSEETAQLFDRKRLFHSIKKGKRGTVMPAWETVLNDQQVANIAEYVYQNFIKKKH